MSKYKKTKIFVLVIHGGIILALLALSFYLKAAIDAHRGWYDTSPETRYSVHFPELKETIYFRRKHGGLLEITMK